MKVINYQVKHGYALALACSIYAIFLFFLIFDIQLPLSKKHPITETILSSQTITPKIKSKGPAPVRYYSPPKKQLPPTPKPQAFIPKPAAQQAELKENTIPALKAEPKKEEPKKTLPQEEKRKITKKETKKKEAIPRYKKRSRDKWFKQGATPEQPNQPQHPKQTQQAFAAQMSHGFNNYVNKQKAERAQYSIPDVSGNRVQSLEYEMFVGKVVHAVCDASHAKPLKPHTPLVKGHSIAMRITCDHNRKITDVTFTQPSYDYQITEYIEELLYSITPPKLPPIHTKEKLTLPLRIYVDRQYYARNITLVPA